MGAHSQAREDPAWARLLTGPTEAPSGERVQWARKQLRAGADLARVAELAPHADDVTESTEMDVAPTPTQRDWDDVMLADARAPHGFTGSGESSQSLSQPGHGQLMAGLATTLLGSGPGELEVDLRRMLQHNTDFTLSQPACQPRQPLW